MRYQTKLLIVSGVFLFLSLFAAGMAYWGLDRSNHYFERSRMARTQLEGYLKLTAHTYELFKQWSDAMLIGESALERARINLTRQLEADINLLRYTIEREIEHSGLDDETKKMEEAELERIAEIRKQLLTILYEFGRIEALTTGGKPDEARKRLVVLLQNSIDTRFRYLIDLAIADELKEVITIDDKADATHSQLSLATKIYVASVILFTLGCVFMLLRQLRQPLQNLLEGTRAITTGDLTHRIRVKGKDEFAELGVSFNQMASELAAQRKSLENSQAELEDEVAKQTEELRQVNETLEKADIVRRRFFADISHELRTPLTVVRGEGQITLRGKDKTTEEYKTALSRIVEQAKHMSVLVDDLLFLAREDVGELRLRRRDVAIADLLKHVCQDIELIAKEKRISLQFNNDAEATIFSGDEGRLRQLFLILIDNAIRYSHEDSSVTVSIKPDGDGAVIEVADEGIGIAEDEIDLVFERFGRGANAQSHNVEGVGLGLPLAKSITEAHGGTIKIKSAVNEGTTFTVRFAPVKVLEAAS